MRDLTIMERTDYFFNNVRNKGRKTWVLNNDHMSLILGEIKRRESKTNQSLNGLSLFESFCTMLRRGVSFKETNPGITNKTARHNIRQILLEYTNLQPEKIRNITLNSIRATALVRSKVKMSNGKSMEDICVEYNIMLL